MPDTVIAYRANLVPHRLPRGFRVPDISHALEILNATVFLYPSVEDAEKGHAFGGSGVLIGIPAPGRDDLHFVYAVSNWHVVCDSGASVVRIVDKTGHVHIWETDSSQWTFIPGGPDLAAIPLRMANRVNPAVIPLELFISTNEPGDVILGDDIFMAGRFIDYDGNETNQPALRFGAVSMIGVPITQPTRYAGPSFVVDMHSRTGFSGSPVYVYRPGNMTSGPGGSVMGFGPILGAPTARSWGFGNNTFIKLLGIQWGQFPEAWEIANASAEPSGDASLIREGAYVRGLSGMSCVVPADDIRRLLNLPELAKFRSGISLTNIPLPEKLGSALSTDLGKGEG